MTRSTDTAEAAPGIAFQALLRNAKTSALRGMIGPSIVDTLHGLEPELVSGLRLGELAARLVEPSEALRNPAIRERIIRMLPLSKARELGSQLGAEDGRALYDDLCVSAADPSALATLFSFFGVVRDVRAPADSSPDAMNASAGYALFDHQRTVADRVKSCLADTPRKVVLHMPTGAGKTRTAMHLVASPRGRVTRTATVPTRGSALLRGLAVCGVCSRRVSIRSATPSRSSVTLRAKAK